MAAFLKQCHALLSKIEYRVFQLLGIHPPPALGAALAIGPSNSSSSEDIAPNKSILETILGDGMLWAVPKSRRSREKRKTRMYGIVGHFEDAIPKKNIVACLECGHWHEKFTICGNCYEKVRLETKEMKEQMSVDDFKYNAPRTEVVYLYEGEEKERPIFEGKYIVEMPKKKPQWWSRNLLVKGNHL